jgi:MFS family permease
VNHDRHSPSHRRRVFRFGLLRAGLVAGVLVGASLVAGILGYHHFARLGWVDAFYSASMIMSGMGPTDPLQTPEAKIFAGVYALYSGLVLIASTGVVLSPFMTHVLHAFHAEEERPQGPGSRR